MQHAGERDGALELDHHRQVGFGGRDGHHVAAAHLAFGFEAARAEEERLKQEADDETAGFKKKGGKTPKKPTKREQKRLDEERKAKEAEAEAQAARQAEEEAAEAARRAEEEAAEANAVAAAEAENAHHAQENADAALALSRHTLCIERRDPLFANSGSRHTLRVPSAAPPHTDLRALDAAARFHTHLYRRHPARPFAGRLRMEVFRPDPAS